MDALEKGFGLEELRVDPQSGEVSGPGGREKLDRKVMKVLLHMAQHAGHVVAREDLLATLWPGTVVTDDALTRCFYELRRHLSHAGGDERYRALVETLPKRGYRLNGTVVPLAPDSGVHPPRTEKAIADMGSYDGGGDSPGGHRLTDGQATSNSFNERSRDRQEGFNRGPAIPRHEC